MEKNSGVVREVQIGDSEAWYGLWQRYCEFYKVDLAADISRSTWDRIVDPSQQIYCLVATDKDGRVIGFANYVLHPYTWSSELACYMEDLFVDSQQRGHGIGKLLIEGLLRLCRENGWTRLYWHTAESNATARRLYDQFCQRDDRVRYSIDVGTK